MGGIELDFPDSGESGLPLEQLESSTRVRRPGRSKGFPETAAFSLARQFPPHAEVVSIGTWRKKRLH